MTHQIRSQTGRADITDGLLCRLCLLFATNNGNQGNVNLEEVLLSGAAAELAHSFNKRRRLDISNSASQLDDTDVGSLVGLVDGNLGNALNPVLDGVRKMGDDLDGLSEVISSPLNRNFSQLSSVAGSMSETHLTLNDMLVNLPGRDVVLASKGDVEVTLVVSEV